MYCPVGSKDQNPLSGSLCVPVTFCHIIKCSANSRAGAVFKRDRESRCRLRCKCVIITGLHIVRCNSQGWLYVERCRVCHWQCTCTGNNIVLCFGPVRHIYSNGQ